MSSFTFRDNFCLGHTVKDASIMLFTNITHYIDGHTIKIAPLVFWDLTRVFSHQPLIGVLTSESTGSLIPEMLPCKNMILDRSKDVFQSQRPHYTTHIRHGEANP